MTAMSKERFEELIGKQMAELAHKEGHRPGLPKIDLKAVEKLKATRYSLYNHANTKRAEENKRLVLAAFMMGARTVTEAAKKANMGIERARHCVHTLVNEGVLEHYGILHVQGGQSKLYRIIP